MHLAAPFLAVATLFAAIASPSPDTTLATAPHQAGATFEVTASHEMKMSIAIHVGGQELQKMPMHGSGKIAAKVAVKAADEKGASEATLAFGDCSEITPNPMAPAEPQPTDCSGKSYAAKRGAAGLLITGPAPELSDDETLATGMIATHLLEAAPLAGVLGGKALKKGDAIELPADLAQRCLGFFADDAKVQSVKLTLSEEPAAGSDAVVFQVAAKLVSPKNDENPAEMTMELAGTWTVAKATSRVVAMALKGPITLNGSMDEGGMKMEMKGSGDMTVAWNAAPK